MGLGSNIERRGRQYYFRARTPADLVPVTGRELVVRSLQTSDPRCARERAAKAAFFFSWLTAKLRFTMKADRASAVVSREAANKAALQALDLGLAIGSKLGHLRAKFHEGVDRIFAYLGAEAPGAIEGILDAMLRSRPGASGGDAVDLR